MLKTKLSTLLFRNLLQCSRKSFLTFPWSAASLAEGSRGFLTAVLISIIFFTSACGFRPLYSSSSGFNEKVREKLVTTLVEVESEEARPEQELKNSLYDLLNPTGLSTEKKYLLKVALAKDLKPTIIEQDRTITRYSLVYTANYSLINRTSGEVIDSGATTIQGSYDALGSLYTVHIAEGDTSSRVLRELAKDLEMRVGGAFINKPNN